MATLFDQPPRQDALSLYVSWVHTNGVDLGFDMKDPKQVHAACDLIRTALAIQNADTLDEQLGGFGELLRDFVDTKEE